MLRSLAIGIQGLGVVMVVSAIVPLVLMPQAGDWRGLGFVAVLWFGLAATIAGGFVAAVSRRRPAVAPRLDATAQVAVSLGPPEGPV